MKPTSKSLLMAFALFLVGTAFFILTYLMVDLYSKRQTLEGIFFHVGIGSWVVSFSLVISSFFQNEKSSRMNFLLLAFSTLFIVYSAEIGLRVSGVCLTEMEKGANGRYSSFLRLEKRNSWYRIHPKDTTLTYFRNEFDFQRSTNSLGLSERKLTVEKKGIRIIGLGDSFTEGTGVHQDSTWLRRVESELTKQFPDTFFETINAGIGGSDPVWEYQLLKDKLIAYVPDIVILSINSSDIGDIAYRGGFERFNSNGTSGREEPSWEWIYQQSHAIRLIAHNAFKLNHYLISPDEVAKGRQESVAIMEEVIALTDSLSDEFGFEFLLVAHPIIQDFSAHTYIDSELIQITSAARSKGFNVLEIRDCFKDLGVQDEEDAQAYYWPVDRHFNQKGYDVYGDCVTNAVIQILDKDPEILGSNSIPN